MIEIFSVSLWVLSVAGLTWMTFAIPLLFGFKISPPAKVAFLIPVIAINVVISSKAIKYLKFIMLGL
ncbi:hypothetical protein PS914_01784 [Pseudomonas fluorescens]|uniref:hypothetical protein n=1 Tax=Pseudomonas fluorescens TaxID=294 RepID=UPI0012409458|nr:hypothetical protein [Pseudomonas fluorescens]VVP76537.1 hypothetical protein PS914_01784 [Pseudomonas fluorescens]